MTEPVEQVESAEQPVSNRRGRPRPASVIERDEQVFSALTSPMTRDQLAEASGVPKEKVYLSMFRLRDAGRIRRERQGSTHIWTRVEPATPTG